MLDRKRSNQERTTAINLVSRFRAAHSLPINTFQATLHAKLRSFKGSFMAQRLKRMPAIFRKLRKEHSMQVTTMQDIGGLRAVVNTVKEVYELERKYATARFEHEPVSEIDYIAQPKKSGYRGLHLIYRYNNKRNPGYNGLLLEIQIRTKLQHSWATAVEIMETITKQPLKSSRGSQEWLDFFALVSSAFAYLENSPRVPGYTHLSQAETFRAVRVAEKRLNVRTVMKALPFIVKEVSEQPQASQYHLVVQDFDKKEVLIRSYSRVSLPQATKEYAKYEEVAREGGKHMNVVLVSAGTMAELQRAYPNLFLESPDFIKNLNRILDTA